MLLSVVSVLVVAQSSLEVPEGLMNNPVYFFMARFLGLTLRQYIPHKSLFSTTLQNMSKYTIIINNSKTAMYEHQAYCSLVGCDVTCLAILLPNRRRHKTKNTATFISTVITQNRIVMLLYHTFCLKFHVTAFHSQ